MGLSPADLAAAPRQRKAIPTFAEYIPSCLEPSPLPDDLRHAQDVISPS
jgi:hypothetical protein